MNRMGVTLILLFTSLLLTGQVVEDCLATKVSTVHLQVSLDVKKKLKERMLSPIYGGSCAVVTTYYLQPATWDIHCKSATKFELYMPSGTPVYIENHRVQEYLDYQLISAAPTIHVSPLFDPLENDVVFRR